MIIIIYFECTESLFALQVRLKAQHMWSKNNNAINKQAGERMGEESRTSYNAHVHIYDTL